MREPGGARRASPVPKFPSQENIIPIGDGWGRAFALADWFPQGGGTCDWVCKPARSPLRLCFQSVIRSVHVMRLLLSLVGSRIARLRRPMREASALRARLL